MQSFIKSRKVLGATAGIASLAAVLGGGLMAAQGTSSVSAAGSQTALASFVQQASPTPAQGTSGSSRMETYLQDLAKNLGIDETKLKDALKQTSLDQVQADLAAGKITQAQADQMTQAIQNGNGPLFGFGGRGGPGGPRNGAGPIGPGMRQDDAALAQFLGIDQATLEQAEQSGQSLAAIASAHGKSATDLKTFLTTQEQTRLNTAVSSGKITQQQADTMLQQFNRTLDARINATHTPGTGPHFGPRGGNQGQTPSTTPGTN